MPETENRCREGTVEYRVLLNSSHDVFCCGLALKSKKVECQYCVEREINRMRLPFCTKTQEAETLESTVQEASL